MRELVSCLLGTSNHFPIIYSIIAISRFKQGNPSSSHIGGTSRVRADSVIDPELEEARPSSIGEEEMQLQIALALSREESEKVDEMRKSDEVRLQVKHIY